MPDKRPAIPRSTIRDLLIECGHRCAVCGDPSPLERAHIRAWSKTQDHALKNLICLCASCHQRADTELWGEETLRQYKKRPWVLRRLAPPTSSPSSSSRLQRLIDFQAEFFHHAPPSETDTSLRRGHSDLVISDIARRWCEAVAAKYDSAVIVYRQYRDTLPESSVRHLDKAVQRIHAGRGKWMNRAAKHGTMAVGSNLSTAALEYHFHRIVCDSIEIEIREERGLCRGAKFINNIGDLIDIGQDDEV